MKKNFKDIEFRNKIQKITEILDFSNLKPIELGFGEQDKTFNINDLEIKISIQDFDFPGIYNIIPLTLLPTDKSLFRRCYNIGFTVNEQVSKGDKKFNLKEYLPILGIITKSVIKWIEINEPYIVTIIADDINSDFKLKKHMIYASIIEKEIEKLDNYDWDYFKSPKMGSSIYLKKINKK